MNTKEEPLLIRVVFNDNARHEYGDPERHGTISPRDKRAILHSPYCKGYFGYADGWNLFSQFTEDKKPFRFGLHRILQVADERFEPCQVRDKKTGALYDAMIWPEGGVWIRCRHEERRKGLDPLMDGLLHWDEAAYELVKEDAHEEY